MNTVNLALKSSFYIDIEVHEWILSYLLQTRERKNKRKAKALSSTINFTIEIKQHIDRYFLGGGIRL